VTPDQPAVIDRIRQPRSKGHRFLYFNREETLIAKLMAGPVLELVSQGFGGRLDGMIAGMGLFEDIGRTQSAT